MASTLYAPTAEDIAEVQTVGKPADVKELYHPSAEDIAQFTQPQQATGGGAMKAVPGSDYEAMSPNERHATDLLSNAAIGYGTNSALDTFNRQVATEQKPSITPPPAKVLPPHQWGDPGSTIYNDAQRWGGIVSRPVVGGNMTVATFGKRLPSGKPYQRFYGVDGNPLPANDMRVVKYLGAKPGEVKAQDFADAFPEAMQIAGENIKKGAAMGAGLVLPGSMGALPKGATPTPVDKALKAVPESFGNVVSGTAMMPFQVAQEGTAQALSRVSPAADREAQEFAQGNINAAGLGAGGPLEKIRSGDIKGGVKQLVQSAEEHPVEWAAGIAGGLGGLIHGNIRAGVGLRDGLLERANVLDRTAEGADTATAQALYNRADTLRGQAAAVGKYLPKNAPPARPASVSKRQATSFPETPEAAPEMQAAMVEAPTAPNLDAGVPHVDANSGSLTGLIDHSKALIDDIHASVKNSQDAGQAVRDMEAAAEGQGQSSPYPANEGVPGLTPINSRADFEKALSERFGYTPEQVAASSEAAAGHARLYESQTGQPAASWYPRAIAAIAKGEGETAAPKVATVPEVQTAIPAYIQEEIDRRYEQAKSLGIDGEIEDLSAQRLTKKQIAGQLAPRLNMSASDVSDIVNGVRAKRGIPSMDDKTEFDNWLKNRKPDPAPVKPSIPEPLTPGMTREPFRRGGATPKVDAAVETDKPLLDISDYRMFNHYEPRQVVREGWKPVYSQKGSGFNSPLSLIAETSQKSPYFVSWDKYSDTDGGFATIYKQNGTEASLKAYPSIESAMTDVEGLNNGTLKRHGGRIVPNTTAPAPAPVADPVAKTIPKSAPAIPSKRAPVKSSPVTDEITTPTPSKIVGEPVTMVHDGEYKSGKVTSAADGNVEIEYADGSKETTQVHNAQRGSRRSQHNAARLNTESKGEPYISQSTPSTRIATRGGVKYSETTYDVGRMEEHDLSPSNPKYRVIASVKTPSGGPRVIDPTEPVWRVQDTKTGKPVVEATTRDAAIAEAKRLAAEDVKASKAWQQRGYTLNQANDQTNTPEFKRWFGDSKVVDADGKPLTVYHGAGGKFDTFQDIDNKGAYWFASDKADAARYGSDTNNIKAVHLRMENDGWKRYQELIDSGVSRKNVNRVLKDEGYDGYHEPGGMYVVFDNKQIKHAENNRGNFDPTDANILHDQRQGSNKGSVNFQADGKAIIRALDSPDASTVPHELGHIFRRSLFRDKLLPAADLAYIEEWAGVKDGNWTPVGEDGKLNPVHEEKWARAFERYLSEGKADWAPEPLQKAFAAFKSWMQDIYNGIKGSAIDVELTPRMREIFAKTLGKGLDEPVVKTSAKAEEPLPTKPEVKAAEPTPTKPKPEMIASINPDYTGLDAAGNAAVKASAERTGTQKRFVSWDSRRKSARDMDLQIEQLKDTVKFPIDQLPVDKDGNHVNANDYVLNLRNLERHFAEADKNTFRDYQEAVRNNDADAPKLLNANKEAQATLDAITPRLSYFVGEKGRGLNEQKIIPAGHAPTEAARLREDLNAAPSLSDVSETPKPAPKAVPVKAPRKTQNRSAKKVYSQEDFDAAREAYRARREDGVTLNQSADEPYDKTLVALHNTTGNGILAADRLGGIPAPAIAITRHDLPFDSYGDVSLVGNRQMVDPLMSPSTKVFGSDVYSPRQPKESHTVIPKLMDKFVSDVVNPALINGENKGSYDWGENSIRRDDTKQELISDMARSPQVRAAYLKAQGRPVDIPFEKKYSRPTIDRWTLRHIIDDALKIDPGHEAKIEDWVRSHIDDAFKGPFLDKNGRKAPYTLDNLVSMMTGKGIRGLEGGMFTNSLGAIRAKGVKELKDVPSMHKAKGSIVGEKDFEAYREQTDKEWNDVQTELFDAHPDATDRYMSMQVFDRAGDALSYYVKGAKTEANFRNALRRNGFTGDISADTIRKGMDVVDRLMKSPTEYFEAKPKRAVRLREFSGALVPKGSHPDVMAALKAHGLDVREYDNNVAGDRNAKLNDLASSREDVLFQKAPHKLTEDDIADLTAMGAFHIENGKTDLPSFSKAILNEEPRLNEAQVERIRANAFADIRDKVKKSNRKLAGDVFTDQLAVKFGSRGAVRKFLDAIDDADGGSEILDKIIHGQFDQLTPAQAATLEQAYKDNSRKFKPGATTPGALADMQAFLSDMRTKQAKAKAKANQPPGKTVGLPLTPEKAYTQSVAARVGAQNVGRFNSALTSKTYGADAMAKLKSGEMALDNNEKSAVAEALLEARLKRPKPVARDDIAATMGQIVRDVQSGRLNYDDPVQRVRKLLTEIDPANSAEHTTTLAGIETDAAGKPTDKGFKELLAYRDKVSAVVAKREFDALPDYLKALTSITQVTNTLRSLITSYDVSAPGRQGGFLMAANPVMGFKSFPDMFKALASERAADAVDYQIKSRPNNANGYYERAGLALTSMDKHSGTLGKLSQHEENYLSHFSKKIPGVHASERAYVTFLNKLRADNFDLLVNTMKMKGKPITDGDLKQIGTFINDATGRGSLGNYDSAGALLSNLMFSPRFLMSRIRLSALTPIWGRYGGSNYARGLIARTYIQSAIGTAVVLGMLKMAGADVNTDRQSSNFLKATYKNHVIVDPMAGFSQLWTFLSRIAPDWAGGGYTTTQDGNRVPLDGKGMHGTRASTAVRFLRSKASPIVGTGWDILEGKDYLGDPITPAGEITKNIVPMSWPDIVEAGKKEGIPTATMVMIGNMFGVGSNYQPKKLKTRPPRPIRPTTRPPRPVRPGTN